MNNSMIWMVLRYLACAVVSAVATLITWLGSPIWAALSFTTRIGNEPRMMVATHINPFRKKQKEAL